MASSVTIEGGEIRLDGQPYRVLSGALHYFRVHPEQWEHRLRMLRAMGLDCVETYVPWNLHEPREGVYEFSGIADLERFLELAAEVGLNAIVRPGPYICAEWDAGGLPTWLLARRDVALRCADPRYLEVVDAWFGELIPRIAAHQVTRGGNVIMVQVENEYGSYGSDKTYLRHVKALLERHGIEVPLFTSDGPSDLMLTGGIVDDVVATVNFGSRAAESFAELRKVRATDPLFCMEFWCGWFGHWGTDVPARPAAEVAGELAAILDEGASVNIYMAHGGTNFAGWSGANRGGQLHDADYKPTITSYDYRAPIDELGRPTELFTAMREVMVARGAQAAPLPEASPLLPLTEVTLTQSADLLSFLRDDPDLTRVEAASPLSFEELGLQYGLVLHTATVPGPRREQHLHLDGLADRAHVLVDGVLAGVLSRDGDSSLPLAVTSESAGVEILVEGMGRVNYGPNQRDLKGLRGVRHERQYVHGFTQTLLDLSTPPAVTWTDGAEPGVEPRLYRGEFEVTEPGDTLVVLDSWTKGHLWVNGFALGRYWNIGPQQSLYVPGPILRPGRNEIVILELDGTSATTVTLDATTRDRG